MSRFALVGICLLVAACASAAPTPQIIYVTPAPTTAPTVPPPTAQSTANGTPIPTTQHFTPAPVSPTPQVTAQPTPAPASVTLVRSKLLAYKLKFSDYVDFIVVAEFRNDGAGWAHLEAFSSDYAIYDGNGAVVTTGSFLYAYPDYLAPGQTGYLVDDSSQNGYAVSDFATLEVNGRYSDAFGPPTINLVVSNVTLRKASFGEGLEVTGQVENTGTEAADSAHAVAIYFDAQGEIIGASYTNLIENVAPGQKKAFETIDSNPVNRSDVADFVVIASAF